VSLEALHISYDFIGGWEEATVYARRPGQVRKSLIFAHNLEQPAQTPVWVGSVSIIADKSMVVDVITLRYLLIVP